MTKKMTIYGPTARVPQLGAAEKMTAPLSAPPCRVCSESVLARRNLGITAKEANRCAQHVADHVGQHVVLPGLADAVALAQPLHLNYGLAHPLTM